MGVIYDFQIFVEKAKYQFVSVECFFLDTDINLFCKCFNPCGGGHIIFAFAVQRPASGVTLGFRSFKEKV